MDDDECPHGLNPAWCSICLQRAAKPAAAHPPRTRPPRTRPARSRTGSVPREPRVAVRPLEPPQALARLRPVLFHAAGYRAWPSIAAAGLQSAAKLAAHAGTALESLRQGPLDLELAGGGTARVRDQRTLVRGRIEQHLDGLVLADWLALVNERVWFFARQKELTTLLTRCQQEGQDLIVVDTAKLIAAAGERVEVTTVNTGEPVPWDTCACRGRDTFVPVGRFVGDVSDIEEVTVVGGIDQVAGLVVRVVRHHPDRGPEVLVG